MGIQIANIWLTNFTEEGNLFNFGPICETLFGLYFSQHYTWAILFTSIVVCCCKLNNTQDCDEHLFGQVSTCTGRYVLLRRPNIKKRLYIVWIVDQSAYGLDQGWPHFLCCGQKNRLKKLSRHNNVSKKAWRAKFYLVKTHNRASLTF